VCLIFISLKEYSQYKLIVAANRDEFYNRKTAAADFWPDQPNILGGRDLEAGGTWLGISKNGRVSMITNYRDPHNIRANAPSRGHLVSDYLAGTTNSFEYMQTLVPKAKDYNGFNLVTGTTDQLHYFSNYGDGITTMDKGLFGLSNHLLDTPWPKVKKGKEYVHDIISKPFTSADLFQLLYNEQIAADDVLPDTGVGLERERWLSAMFIKSPGYGTRCSTVILVDYDNTVSFAERVYDLSTFSYSEKSFTFKTDDH
jgi:uncharacterized protein with NRDE domain